MLNSAAFVLLALAVAILMFPQLGESKETMVDVAKTFLESSGDDNGTKWAVLVAGSKGYVNYRHQADVCHAYQLMKRGGLKDENIIVFMYDDIAMDPENPTPGIIINKPNGPDVYKGVPKDYTGNSTTARNLYAVLLAHKAILTGGSGKMLESGPDDHVFFYYADHGASGLLAMPAGYSVYANDLNNVFKKMHDSKRYKNMVVYIEACESGSMFDGILPENIGIYATTASDPSESSFGYYCDVAEYDTCLGDLYSIAWMEDSDQNDPDKETLQQQYMVVKQRTKLSHVMQYGDKTMSEQFLSTYIGKCNSEASSECPGTMGMEVQYHTLVSQRDVDLLYYQRKVEKKGAGSVERAAAQKMLDEELLRRGRVDAIMEMLVRGAYVSSGLHASTLLKRVRPAGQPAVDDWECFKALVRTYEQTCGPLSSYGTKYARLLANMCNDGVNKEKVKEVAIRACST